LLFSWHCLIIRIFYFKFEIKAETLIPIFIVYISVSCVHRLKLDLRFLGYPACSFVPIYMLLNHALFGWDMHENSFIFCSANKANSKQGPGHNKVLVWFHFLQQLCSPCQIKVSYLGLIKYVFSHYNLMFFVFFMYFF